MTPKGFGLSEEEEEEAAGDAAAAPRWSPPAAADADAAALLEALAPRVQHTATALRLAIDLKAASLAPAEVDLDVAELQVKLTAKGVTRVVDLQQRVVADATTAKYSKKRGTLDVTLPLAA